MGNYYVYIVTNPGHTVLYIGVTNELKRRLVEHYENRGKPTTFAGKFSVPAGSPERDPAVGHLEASAGSSSRDPAGTGI